jgi:Zn-dependent protease with chaperone function
VRPRAAPGGIAAVKTPCVAWAAALALVALVTLAAPAVRPSCASPSGPLAAADPGGVVSADTGAATSAAPTEPAAPRDYIAEVRSNFTPENRHYATKRVTLALIEPLYGALAALVLLFSGFSARMRDVAHRVGSARYVRVLVYLALYSVAGWALTFPLSWLQGFALEHQYHLSNQNFGQWFVDELKGLGLSFVFLGVVPIAALSYWGIAKRPRDWWLWLAIGSFPVTVMAILIQPLVIDPAFNKFTPLHDKQLESKILALAEKAGIPGRRVFEVNKSAQTKKLNAYVSGFGASQRIVLWDTTLKDMKEDEILFVMGHEMGHYVLHHIWKGIMITVALSALFFFLSFVFTGWAVARFGPRWGFTELSDVASLPLIVGTIGLISFVAQPMTNSFTRAIEHEADQFGLEVTQLNDAGARAFIKLGAGNKSNPEPNPIIKAFVYTHPPLVERIRYALDYHPWTEGKPNAKFHGKS